MAEMGSPFALSASEEKQFADMEAGLDGPVADDLDDIAARDPDAADDVATADAPETEVEWDADKKVSFRAMDKWRKTAKAMEAEKAQLLSERAMLQERVNAIMAAYQGRQQAEQPAAAAPVVEEVPDPDTDIFAYAKWQAKKLAELESTTKQTAQTFQQQQYKQQVAQVHLQAEAAFAEQQQDYYDAVNWAKKSRYDELMHYYSLTGVPQQQAHSATVRQIEQDAYQIIEAALKGRHNPAEAAYRYAVSRGYTPKQAQAMADAADGSTDRPRDETGKFVAQRDPKLDQVAAAQARNKSLSNTAGQAGKVDLTVDRLAKMSDKEFKAFLAKDEDNEAFFKAVNGR